jgi:hypothetical protein
MLMWGCGGDEPVRQPDYLIYFPLQTGFYQIYDVIENNYSEINDDEFLTYELKMEVIDSFPNLGGGFTYVIHRSKRATVNDPWQFYDTWSAQSDEQQAIMSEGNTPYIRLSFPLTKDRKWNANALNSQGEDLYEVQSIESYELDNNVEFKKSVVVEQEDELNLLLRDQRMEVYAPNVGLIYRKRVVINYCDEGPCVGQQVIKDGTEYFQTLKSYGQN